MHRWLLLVLIGSFSATLKAEDGSELRLYCDDSRPQARLTLSMGEPQGPISARTATPERIDAGQLVIYTEEDEKGEVHRTGSRSITRTCGGITIKVSGGFYNARTLGEMGAAEDYPIVELFEGSRPLTRPLALGECVSSNGRYSYSVECPRDWASEVRVFYSDGKPSVLLRHVHEEYR